MYRVTLSPPRAIAQSDKRRKTRWQPQWTIKAEHEARQVAHRSRKDVVDAALAGLAQGELVTIPSPG